MNNGNGTKTANRAIVALAGISIFALTAGIVVAFYHGQIGGIVAIATGAVGGIVAIVLRIQDTGGKE